MAQFGLSAGGAAHSVAVILFFSHQSTTTFTITIATMPASTHGHQEPEDGGIETGSDDTEEHDRTELLEDEEEEDSEEEDARISPRQK